MKWGKFYNWILFIALIVAVWNNSLGFSFFFSALLLGRYLDTLEKKLTKLDNISTETSVFRFFVNPYEAIIKNSRFREIVGLSSKPISEWTKSEHEKLWGKNGIREKYKEHLFGANFWYLPKEDAFFVNGRENNQANIVIRKFDKTLLYLDEIIQGHLTLEIWVRYPGGVIGTLRKTGATREMQLAYLTVCLKYQPGEFPSDEDEFNILCELPLTQFLDRKLMGEKKFEETLNNAQEYIKEADFKEHHDSWPDMPMKDDFGEQPEQVYINDYSKNGVMISFVA